jgi:hypothetical protein
VRFRTARSTACVAVLVCSTAAAPQTPPRPVTAELPFGITLTSVAWKGKTPLPKLQSFASAHTEDGKWLLISGLTMGLHQFDDIGQLPPPSHNFPQERLNERIWVVDPRAERVWSAPLPAALLHTLAVVAPQAEQQGDRLYINGGYGYTGDNQAMITQATFTVVDVAETVAAVISRKPIGAHIRQAPQDEYLRVTGGKLLIANNRFLIVFGHNFQGFYNPQTNGQYTYQVRTFQAQDDGQKVTLSNPKSYGSQQANPDFRRRDLNVVPAIRPNGTPGFTALAGVFTTETGPWLTPIYIDPTADGFSVTTDTTGFQQYLNQYSSANLPVWSAKSKLMSTVLFGGIGEGYYHPVLGFKLDQGVPFVDEVTSVTRAADGTSKQYLLTDGSSGTRPNALRMPGLLGAEAHLMPDPASAKWFRGGVVYLDEMTETAAAGYIFGGIEAQKPNFGQSSAANELIRVEVVPKATTAIVVNVTP